MVSQVRRHVKGRAALKRRLAHPVHVRYNLHNGDSQRSDSTQATEPDERNGRVWRSAVTATAGGICLRGRPL